VTETIRESRRNPLRDIDKDPFHDLTRSLILDSLKPMETKVLGVFTSLDEPQDVVISENINLPG